MKSSPRVALSKPVADEVRKTTCYMCACRCGINVHIKDGKIRYIEGNRDHPVNKGVLCAKGSAGIMQHYAPARLRAPLLRTGPRGSGEFREISWDEALELAAGWLGQVRETDPKKLAFFTGRDQSQSLTGFWAQQFGTPNYAAHGGFCSVNMAAAGIMTIGGAFWEFGAPDWERTKLFVMFGVAEDHDSNPLKMGIAKVKKNGARFVSVNPVRTGYSAVADNWIGIRPGTDGLLILAVVHELLKARKIDVDYLMRYSNAPWLVIDAPGTAEHGLFARDAEGKAMVFETVTERPVPEGTKGARPALSGRFQLDDGRFAVPSFQLLAEKYLDPKYAPEAVARETGVAPEVIRGLAAEIARVAFDEAISIDQPWTDMHGERHESFVGRPVSFHAMRGLSAHSNGFQTARALHMLQVLIGAVDCPGAFRYEPPYPKPVEAHPTPHGRAEHFGSNKPLSGPHLGFPRGPEDMLIDAEGRPNRIDKAFSWDAPFAVHGAMHMVIANAHAGDPYPVDVLFLYMANMAWNSSMNTAGVIKMLEDKDPATGDYKIPEDHLLRRLCVGNGRLRRPRAARHHLSRAPRLHLAARPADLRTRRRAGCNPLAGDRTRPRRARLPDGAARSCRPAEAQRFRRPSRQGALQGLCRLYRAPRAAAGHRAAGRFSRRRRRPHGQGSGQSRPAETLYRERVVLLRPYSASRRSFSSTPTRRIRISPCAWASSTRRSR